MTNTDSSNKFIIGGYVLVAIAIIATLFVAVALDEGTLSNLLFNGDWTNNYYNLEYQINSGYDLMSSGF